MVTARLVVSEKSVTASGKERVAQRVDAVAERIEAHAEAQPSGCAAGGEERAGEHPQRQQNDVDDGVEGLRRVHRPRNGEAERGEFEADHDDDQGAEGIEAGVGMDADQRREDEEDDALNRGQRRSAEDFAQHDGRAAYRRGEHREQEAFVAVLDERHHAEDGGEEDDHGDRSGKEVAEIMAGSAASRCRKTGSCGRSRSRGPARRSAGKQLRRRRGLFGGRSGRSRAATMRQAGSQIPGFGDLGEARSGSGGCGHGRHG